jgi:4a-hydroxytetrahydrobiopterin dehydratase
MINLYKRLTFLSIHLSNTHLSTSFVHNHPRHHCQYSPSDIRSITMSATEPSAAACTPGGRCVPCESLDESHLLIKEQLTSELKVMKLWALSDDGIKMTKSYTARNFQAAMDSINAIGSIAERENHHPDFHLTGYRNVEIVLYTHSLGKIS